MDEKIKEIWIKIKTFFSEMSQKTKRLLVGAVVLVAVIGAAALILIANRPYAVLFTGMTAEDLSSVVTFLEESGVTNYRVEGNDTILVPEKQEPQLKHKLLMENYPSSGFGYSMYLDNIGSLSTESDRKTLYLYELQDRLSAVVRCFNGVKDARVTIAQGEDNRYVLQRDNVIRASAGVLLTMENGQKLSQDQAAAIRSLISSSVQGLVIENITITDTAGNTYSGGDASIGMAAAQLKFDLEAWVNESVRSNILQVLTPLFGAENVYIGVNSTVDVSRTYQDTTRFEEPEWAADGSTGGEGIIGSKIYDNSILGARGNAGGAAGTESNSDISTYVEGYQPAGNEDQVAASGEIKYNVDTIKTQSETPAGVITDVMVSISINSDAVGSVDAEELVSHVARAAGISAEVEEEKISILTSPFYDRAANQEPLAEGLRLPSWALYAAAAAGAVLLLLLALVLLLLRRRRGKKWKQQVPVYAASVPPPVPMGADIMDVHTERSMELRKDVRQFAEDNPEMAAQMVKGWLRGGEDERG